MNKRKIALLVLGLILAASGCGKKAENDAGGEKAGDGVMGTAYAAEGTEGQSGEKDPAGNAEEGGSESRGGASDGDGEVEAGSGAPGGDGNPDSGSGAPGRDGDTDFGSGAPGGDKAAEAGSGAPGGTKADGGITGTEVAQGGPFGRISVRIPEGWICEAYPVDSEELINAEYGMHFAPAEASEGYIELGYIDFFGVCGTGLESREETIGGFPAQAGIYDGHPYWDFIAFKGEAEGVVALSCSVESWWEEYKEQAMEILGTLSYEPDVKEGAVCIYDAESENDTCGTKSGRSCRL